MSSILTNKLPMNININGILYKINSDYRTSIIFAKLIEENKNDEELVKKSLRLYYPVIPPPEFLDEAINYIFWFYTCAENQEENNKSKSTVNNKKIYDYEEDSTYIYSAFLSQYKIDLQEIAYLHWWKFKALFNSLSENNEIVKIMQYRSMDLSKIIDKEQRKFYKKMKELYKLKEKINEEDKKALDDTRKLFL